MAYKQTGSPQGHPQPPWQLLSQRGVESKRGHISYPSQDLALQELKLLMVGLSPSSIISLVSSLTSRQGQSHNHVKPSRLQDLQKGAVSFDLPGSHQACQSLPRNSHAYAIQAFQTRHTDSSTHSTPQGSQLLPGFQQELVQGRNGEINAVRPLCQRTTYPDSLGFTQAHRAQRACCWKSVSLGHEALPGITWYLLQCRVRPGNPGLLAPAQSPLSQGKRLGQKAAEIGRVKYCCRGNVAGHTSRFFAPGCPVSPPHLLTS